MKPARRLMVPLFAAMAAVFSYSLSYAQEPGPLADPKPLNQVGFPSELYSWLIPADNPQTPQKVALGKSLFFDDRFSADNKESCALPRSPQGLHRSAADLEGYSRSVRAAQRADCAELDVQRSPVLGRA